MYSLPGQGVSQCDLLPGLLPPRHCQQVLCPHSLPAGAAPVLQHHSAGRGSIYKSLQDLEELSKASLRLLPALPGEDGHGGEGGGGHGDKRLPGDVGAVQHRGPGCTVAAQGYELGWQSLDKSDGRSGRGITWTH